MSDRLKVLGWVLVAVVGALLVGAALAVDACECCTDPVVKVEWDDGWAYEFNDGSIVVTGTERLLCYEVVSGTAISEIRTEAGQDIECWYPQDAEKASGCLEAGRHDFSNALFCKEPATAVELSSFTAEHTGQVEADVALRFGLVTFCLGFFVGLIVARLQRIR